MIVKVREKLGEMITRHYLVGKDPYPLVLDKKKSKGITLSSFNYSPPAISNFQNNSNHSKPLNHNSNELSFKGFSHVKQPSFIKVSEAVQKFGEIFGESAKKHLNEKIQNAAKLSDSGLKVKDDMISFQPKSLGKRLLDIVLYPILKMPADIANYLLKALKKIPALKNSKNIDKLLDNKHLKERRDFVKSTSDVAAIEHYFEIASDPKEKGKIFNIAHARFKPLLSNYDTTTERTLTRIVTGAIPAFYLANDAYNLSMYMKNDKNDAEQDKKRRFNQEVARIGITAGLTYGVLSLFAKQSNSSAFVATMLMSGITLVSEFVGRAAAGTPVLPVGEKQAKKYASIQAKMYSDKDDEAKKTNPSDTFKGFEGKSQPKEYQKPPEKGNLTIKNVLKVMGVLAIAGLGVDKASNIKPIKKFLTEANDKYKNFLQKELKIKREDFNNITSKLEQNGFKEIADRYKEIVKSQKGDEISLGKVKDKSKDIVVNQILAFPIRFVWDTVMTPYKHILKPILNILSGTKAPAKTDDIKKKDMEMLRDSIQFLQKIDKEKNYQEKVNKSLISSLDNVTKSNYSNSDLASMAKIATSGVTSVFLIADNYNQVMIESNGQNKGLAEQKAKERTIQRGIRIAYGAFIIKLFNGVFAGPYNRSLLGAQAVNIGNTAIVESLERKSVGLPIGESTRDEIIKEERENLNATGIKGGYFRLMAKLTGKKTLSETAVEKEQKPPKVKNKG